MLLKTQDAEAICQKKLLIIFKKLNSYIPEEGNGIETSPKIIQKPTHTLQNSNNFMLIGLIYIVFNDRTFLKKKQ